MEQNKTGKYLKYAIGEIVLVVLGILIALQINNLNQNRIQKATRDSYYMNMITSFDKDLIKIDNYLISIENKQEEIDQFKNAVQKASSFEEASNYVENFKYGFSDIDLNPSIWVALVNSGEIKLLDTGIRNSLLDFWNEYDDQKENDFYTKQRKEDILENYFLVGSGGSAYTRAILMNNEKLRNQSEKRRDYVREVNIALAALRFLEVGNKGNKRRLENIRIEIKNVKSAMQKKVDN